MNVGHNQLYHTMLNNGELKPILADIQPTSFAEGDAPVDADASPPADTPETPDVQTPAADGTFTQVQVNEMMAKDRRRHQEQTKKAMAEVDALRSKARLTTEERDDLDARMQALQDLSLIHI